jgi:nucleotidyltransferase substrate binding protein (TIGR01987 family)
MERLSARLSTARDALATLDELLQQPERSRVERDAAIQRFEYSFEAVWKTVQLYLREVEGLDVGSPKGAARSSFQVGLLDHAETRRTLTMADDRNLTVHTYNEKLANTRQEYSLSSCCWLAACWLGILRQGLQLPLRQKYCPLAWETVTKTAA